MSHSILKDISSISLVLFIWLSSTCAIAQTRRIEKPILNDTLKTTSLSTDSLGTDTIAAKKQPLEAPVKYEANDSVVFSAGNMARLYGKSKVSYEKIELDAERISLSLDSSLVHANGVQDSIGKWQGTPIFKDGNTPYESKSMSYNFKSKRGFINNVVTEQGEGFLTSENAKKGKDDQLYLEHGKYTTCDHHDHPHFYLALTRAKVRPKKNVIFGPAYLVVEDVSLPIFIPFGFFPFTSKYSSGFLMPTYGDETNRGFYLRDGGYYFALNDRFDLALRGEIFTKGSWGINVQTKYKTRYKYSGNFYFSYQVTKTGEKGLPDYTKSKDLKIQWSHRQDPKANPNTNFSASVNFSTSSYEKTNLDSYYNPVLNTQNTRTSSISYERRFPDLNLTISSNFNIAQTMRDSTVNLTLPDLNIVLGRTYPFKKKKRAGEEKWYEKISFSYTGRLSNSIHTKENQLFKSNIIKDWRNGMQHNIPISATFQLFKYINVTPSFNYISRWYTNKIMRSWDTSNNVEKRDTIYGFNRVYNYNFSIGLNTKLYGFYKPWKKLFGDKIEMIRHVITPSISFSAAPDFGSSHYGYYDNYTYTDSNGEVRTVEYSPYSHGLFGVPGKGRQGVISFSVSNNLEMKIKSDKDSTGIRKISLIDELGANISYNLADKKRPWSDLGVNLRMKLSKSYTLNLNTSFATYAYQIGKDGRVYVGDRTEWSYGRFGRFQGAGTSFSYTFDNNTWKKWFGKDDEEDKEKKDKKKTPNTPDGMPQGPVAGEGQKDPQKVAMGNNGYMAFKMPWSLSVSYSFQIRENTYNYSAEKINKKTMRYPYRITHSMSFSGNFKPANRWNISFSSAYDFDANEIAQTTFNITRDLHCFTMRCTLSPFGRWKSYNFSISANASMLMDALKYEKRNSTAGTNIKWY
jgi:lipopolysaccharide assembly outer membrane protein LptD (OstA)